MSQTLHLHETQTWAKPFSRKIVQAGFLALQSHGAGVLHGDLSVKIKFGEVWELFRF